LKRTPAKGFTLLEIMIAIAILVTVAAVLYRSMALTYETKARVSDINDRYHEGRQVMERITREIRMAFLHGMPVEGELEEDPNFVTVFKGDDEELHFASTAHLRMRAESRESDQAEFHYFLKSGDRDDKYKGKTLYRRESSRIDSKPERGGATWPMIDGVKELTFEYWDEKKEIAEDAWKRTWDSQNDEKDLLPARVRITLVLDMGEDRPELRFVSQAAPKLRKPISAEDALNDAKKQAIDKIVEGL
jgi:type II secretion system protein J